ncbi:hypothetical protein KK083_01830 [Fulvivirgaceae bacterium PWU4]|uniref:Uncharacterized protein n=1 Tax=Chryseosolibacter histidini TaxID=2782349 RepID=A0AAP2DFS4_9BACT|nr:tail fiber protein [Chryseosolibacter histidini]MBT1695596.1 hypothetical protein [Chryseosolibacter histidini]
MKLIKVALFTTMLISSQFAMSQDTWIGTTTTTNGKIGLARSGTVKWNIFNETNDDFRISTANGAQSNIIMNANGFLEFRSQTHTVLNIASRAPGVNPYLRFSSNDDLKWSFYNDYNTNDFLFATSTGGAANVKMLIKQNGNIGIGTTDADAKLTVKGDIHTREVRVDMTGPLVPPDYVFEKDYNLLPLSEVEAYINANKHLPEVPSAKEMEANGLNLKEMNLLLLKKVEELTLHLIEANKKIENLDKEVQSLKKDHTR